MSSSVTGRRSSGSMTCSSAFQISSRDGSTATERTWRHPGGSRRRHVLPASTRSSPPRVGRRATRHPRSAYRGKYARDRDRSATGVSLFRPQWFDRAVTWPGLVWRNLMRRAVRTALTAAGVAIGVALIVALLSIAAGVRRTAGDLIHVGRADFGVFQSDASDLTTLAPARVARREARARRPASPSVAAIFLRVSRVENRDAFLVFGLRPDEFAEPALRDRRRTARDGATRRCSATRPRGRCTLGPGDAAPRREEALTASPASTTRATTSRTSARCSRWPPSRSWRSGRAR